MWKSQDEVGEWRKRNILKVQATFLLRHLIVCYCQTQNSNSKLESVSVNLYSAQRAHGPLLQMCVWEAVGKFYLKEPWSWFFGSQDASLNLIYLRGGGNTVKHTLVGYQFYNLCTLGSFKYQNSTLPLRFFTFIPEQKRNVSIRCLSFYQHLLQKVWWKTNK